MKNNNKPIGIIGGMGPFASEHFYKLLLRKSVDLYGAKNNDDFPEVIIDSIPVPDFISDIKNLENAKKMLIVRVTRLNNFGVGNVAMVCNTGHILYDELAKKSKAEFISLLDLVSQEVKRRKCKRVGILATPTTIKYELYDKALSFSKVKIIYPKVEFQKLHEKVIRGVIAGRRKLINIRQLEGFAKDFIKIEKLDALVLGCTELPVIFPTGRLNGKVIDPVDLLADKLLLRYYK